MSEFTCVCGGLMVRRKKRHGLICEDCGGTQIGRMDGMTNAQINYEGPGNIETEEENENE